MATDLRSVERNRSIATLEIVGGHPCLDLANTVASRRDRFGPDLLTRYLDLLDWSVRIGLLDDARAGCLRRLADDGPEDAEMALQRAKALREACYRLFSAIAAGRDAPGPDLDLVSREAGQAQAGLRLARLPDGYGWLWSADDFGTITGRLAHAAAGLVTGPDLARVKECFGRNCGWVFLDTTRNGGRRWCSDRDCGSHARVMRHRSRQRLACAGA